MIDLKTLTKMDMALVVEAERQLRCWWPFDDSTKFWISRAALLAALGERADPELLGVSPAGLERLQRTLEAFNESASLENAAIIPKGWRLVPCRPTEQMFQACLATWPGPRTERPRSLIKRLQVWYAKRRNQGRGGEPTETDARLQWLEEHRTQFTTNFLAMVEEAPPPPWARG